MEQDNWLIIKDALSDAQYLITTEIQSVLDEDIYNEYQSVLKKIECALQIIAEDGISP